MKEIIRSSRKRFRKMFVYSSETNEKNRPLDEFHNLMDREGWERVEQEIVVAR
jgi:hypothetical protein